MAIAVTLGGVVALATSFHVVVQPPNAPDLGLLAQYFYGYSVSWVGIGVGFLWGTGTGFMLGWLAGVVGNLVMRVWLHVMQSRANLAQPFLDDL